MPGFPIGSKDYETFKDSLSYYESDADHDIASYFSQSLPKAVGPLELSQILPLAVGQSVHSHSALSKAHF